MTRDETYLRHILDAIARIEAYTAVGRDEFMAAGHWHDSTIRQLEIIGEASKRITEGLKSNLPDIPWRRIAGLRDVLIHQYMGVDLAAVWEITQKDLPNLKGRLCAAFPELSQDAPERNQSLG